MGAKQSIAKDPDAVRIGILGAALIAPKSIIVPARDIPGAVIVAVASRDKDKGFWLNVYSSYDDLLNDENIDAIYNPLPNSLHCEWTIKALDKGKHVLVEKPFASNAREAEEMKSAAEKNKKVLVEAMHNQYHPVLQNFKKAFDNDSTAIQNIHAEFSLPRWMSLFVPEMRTDNIRFKYSLAGGIMMDAGVYPLAAILWLKNQDPIIEEAKADLLSPQVDKSMQVKMSFEDGTKASFKASFAAPGVSPSFTLMAEGTLSYSLSSFGETIKISTWNFILPHMFPSLIVTPAVNLSTSGYPTSSYHFQLKAFVDQVRGGPPCHTTATNAVRTMKAVDEIYRKAGLVPRGTDIDLSQE